MSGSEASIDGSFEGRGLALCARVRDPETLVWLEEYLGPALRFRGATRDARLPRVSLSVDAPAFRSLCARARATGDTAACFTLDAGGGRLPLFAEDPAAAPWAIDGRYRFAIRPAADASPALPRIEILAERERPGGRMALMRSLRELAADHGLRRGEVEVHASAVAADDGGVTAFVGEKRAGKSTLLLHALLEGGADYVSNDRLSLRMEAGRVTAAGVPTVVTLREGTLALSPPLREEIGSAAWHWASRIREARANRIAGRTAEGLDPTSPPRVSAAQLCALLGAQAREAGPLRRIVFPTVAPDVRRFRLAPLSPDEAAERLCRVGLLGDGRRAHFLTGGVPADPAAARRILREIPKQVACFDCRLGPEAYRAPTVWTAIRGLGS